MKPPTPEDYYAKHFRNDFYLFIRGTHAHERGGYLFIPIQNLSQDRLRHIPHERLPMFYYSLALTTLIDIIMENYFPIDYPEFQAITQYPKFEHGVSALRAGPWQLAELDFKPATFKAFCRFFLDNQKEFFQKREFKSAGWKTLVQSMLADPDIIQGRAGEVFVRVLKEHALN